MSKKKRKRYTLEFKQEVLKLWDDSGKTICLIHSFTKLTSRQIRSVTI